TSKCFITVSVGMVLANRCHRQNMKTSIINGSEVSRLSVAIHNSLQAKVAEMQKAATMSDSEAREISLRNAELFINSLAEMGFN
ncbi:hypothetical protein, partial [Enterobacter intestinihominis]|uniref:hypothetical protein n=3 Tax=Enterobacter intestinihominis TaxID=3133180 RepID=UPI003B42AA7D